MEPLEFSEKTALKLKALLYATIAFTLVILMTSCRSPMSDDTPRTLTPNAKEEPFPASMKGYELYSWQSDLGGELSFALFLGTNRIVQPSELTGASAIKVAQTKKRSEVEAWISRLPNGEYLFWNTPARTNDIPGIVFALPDKTFVEGLAQRCAQRGIHLSVNP